VDIKNVFLRLLIKHGGNKMNIWIVTAIIAGLLIIGGIAVASTVDAQQEIQSDTIAEASECTSCGNSCSVQSNCGLESCAVVSGGGGCGCGR